MVLASDTVQAQYCCLQTANVSELAMVSLSDSAEAAAACACG